MDGSSREAKYEGGALKNQVVAKKLTSADLLGALLFAQNARRKKAGCVATVLRCTEVDGVEREEEIELAVDGYFEDGGFTIYGALRVDNGEKFELTRDEEESIADAECEAYADRRESYEADAYDGAGDR